MKFRHPAILLAILAAVLALVFFGVHRYRYRIVPTTADLPRLLPLPLAEAGVSTFFINVDAIRRAGYLDLLSAAPAPTASDYRQFVQNTNFDYTRDVHALAGAVTADQWTLFIQGQFDWSRLQAYAAQHGGNCTNGRCVLPATRPGKWIGFAELQPNVMSLVIAPTRDLARRDPLTAVATTRPEAPAAVSPDPVWFCPAHSLFDTPGPEPQPVRMLMIALQAADSVTVSLRPARTEAFNLTLKAHFANAAVADTARNQLELDTKMLKLELTREHAQPNPADLTGLLTSGTFDQAKNVVNATWPVPKQFLQTLRQ